MRHVRSLYFESLEERRLLSRTHVAAHAKPVVGGTALVLTGTLKVDNRAAMTSMDSNSDVMISTPVAGQLGTLGQVRGVWDESSDEYGDYLGPDRLQLHSAKGSFVVAFSEQKTDSVNHVAGGVTETVHPQLGSGGTGAYAHSKESGTIELTSNGARTAVVSMTLTTQGM